MSERTSGPRHLAQPHPGTGGPAPDYDPAADPDADPGMLNPRTGGQAADRGEQEPDTDADPDNLNPSDLRPGREETSDDD